MKKTSTRTDDDFWLNEATIENDICDKNISTQSFLDIIIPRIENYIPKEDGSILDVGCGIGRLTEPISGYFQTVTVFGTDINPEFILYAIEKSNNVNNPTYILADNLSVFMNLYVVFSVLVFQHISNEAKKEYIKQVGMALRKGGMFLFQYVEGTYSGRAMYDAEIIDIQKWCAQAGLKIISTTFDRLAPRWTWIEAVKI